MVFNSGANKRKLSRTHTHSLYCCSLVHTLSTHAHTNTSITNTFTRSMRVRVRWAKNQNQNLVELNGLVGRKRILRQHRVRSENSGTTKTDIKPTRFTHENTVN